MTHLANPTVTVPECPHCKKKHDKLHVQPVTTMGMYGKWQGFCPFTFGALFFHSVAPTGDGDRDGDGIPDSQDPNPDSADVTMSAPALSPDGGSTGTSGSTPTDSGADAGGPADGGGGAPAPSGS